LPSKFSLKKVVFPIEGLKEDKMKILMLVLIGFTTIVMAVDRINPNTDPDRWFKIVMTDEKGLPLDDGFYNVTLKVYDKNIDGKLISESKEILESKDGVSQLPENKLKELGRKGYNEIWVSLKIENYPEPKNRTRVFLDTYK